MSILHRLPGNHNNYLLLDGAQFESVERWLYQHTNNPEYKLLYEGTELANAKDVSPCLVDLSNPTLRHLADQFSVGALEHSWGIVVTTFTNVSFEDLIQHLQSRLYVSSATTKKAIFRWYDPRVCKHLLDRSTATEIAELLGPIESIHLASTDGWLAFKNQEQANPNPQLLCLSDKQSEAILNAAQEVYQQRLTQHLNTYFPAKFQPIPPTEQNILINRWIKLAHSLGFEDQLSLTLFCNVLATLGENCLDTSKTQYPEISSLLLKKSSQTAAQRIMEAADLAAETQEPLILATGTES